MGLILAIDPSVVNGDTYFETSALIMTFILLGRYLEILAKSKTYTVLDSLNKHHKGESLLVEGDTAEANTRTISNSLIQRKDILKVLPGERIPTDGKHKKHSQPKRFSFDKFRRRHCRGHDRSGRVNVDRRGTTTV